MNTFSDYISPLIMRIAVPLEVTPGETRVSLIPETVGKLVKAGQEVVVQSGAGMRAYFTDQAYKDAGAAVVSNAREVYAKADLVAKVREPMQNAELGMHEADLIPEGTVYIGFLGRDKNSEAVKKLAARRVTAFSMEMIPRTSRAQKMDALSSMASIAGYKAALWGAGTLGKFFPLMMTAAGTIAPANVFILGAGVAGLQAIATCRRLGAVVEAFDVRPAVREEVQSLGAKFVGLELLAQEAVQAGGYAKELSEEHQRKERELIAISLKKADVVITTAAIPGKKAPLLITEAMVKEMKPGSVIVDLAADSGGNCELTEAGKDVRKHNVLIMGPVNVAASVPFHASQMYSRNVFALIQLMLTKEGKLNLNFDDDIIRDTCITRAAVETLAAGKA
ncbi:MAG: Re/Si-specific NAD(P)(+) transhydrogenase subunit alpha [candidate division Zixibacteria bacterium]|nr:Re/Si-specific NAD(P)(+) transhydrogenase subunit alpha [candidate division Zixibacteria bacterium]